MDQRRKLAYDVLEGGLSLSEACRSARVTRKTGRKWVVRAREQGLDGMSELSRAPHRMPDRTPEAVETALVGLRERYPYWGPRKLTVLLQKEQGIELPVRTAERILSRRGLTRPHSSRPEPVHFERDSCGALLQMDFKGLPRSTPYALLTVLDDHARFCLGFGPVPDKTGASVRGFLWDLFGSHGLPDSMLMDNGDCWGTVRGWSPTAFEAWLMLLGIKPVHGRPHHPQTQGKVERFHLTAQIEIGASLFDPDVRKAEAACRVFVDRYNWVRPHDSLALEVPGTRYAPFPRRRPDALPEPQGLPGDLVRKVQDNGCISYKQTEYKVGRGLIAQRVHLREEPAGMRVYFNNFPLAYLSELGPHRTYGEV
jgi:transposase InsO family protein